MKLAGLVETRVAGTEFSLGQSASLFARVALGVLALRLPDELGHNS